MSRPALFVAIAGFVACLTVVSPVGAINCPDYGCVPEIDYDSVKVNGPLVTGDAAGVQYFNSFEVNCESGQYTVYVGGSNEVIGSGSIFAATAAEHNSVIAAMLGLSCPYEYWERWNSQ